MEYVTLYHASTDFFFGWWVIGAGAIIALFALLLFITRGEKALDGEPSERVSRGSVFFLLVLGAALAGGIGPLLIAQDRTLRESANLQKCRAVEGVIGPVRNNAKGTLMPRMRAPETFSIDGELIEIAPGRIGIGYRRTALSGSIIREGRWLKLCITSMGPSPDDQIILSIAARKADVVFDAARQTYVYRD